MTDLSRNVPHAAIDQYSHAGKMNYWWEASLIQSDFWKFLFCNPKKQQQAADS